MGAKDLIIGKYDFCAVSLEKPGGESILKGKAYIVAVKLFQKAVVDAFGFDSGIEGQVPGCPAVFTFIDQPDVQIFTLGINPEPA
ncbi:hypothetical protein GCM10008910_08770 [Faecalicatena orotica]